MKIEGKIKSVKVARQYQRQDGTFGNIFGVVIERGDDEIFAETFLTKEGQQRRGIEEGRMGTATIEMKVRTWNDREGKEHQTQQANLKDFELANAALQPATEAAPAAPAPQAASEAAPAGEQDASDLPM